MEQHDVLGEPLDDRRQTILQTVLAHWKPPDGWRLANQILTQDGDDVIITLQVAKEKTLHFATRIRLVVVDHASPDVLAAHGCRLIDFSFRNALRVQNDPSFQRV